MIKKILSSLKKHRPKLTRVYSFDEVYKLYGTGLSHWLPVDISDRTDLHRRILNHIKDKPTVYFCSPTRVECSINTERYGWCFLTFTYDLCSVEFGVSKPGYKYSIDYNSQLDYKLYDYLKTIVAKMEDNYKNDCNL